jgi:hypothetical protein
MKNRLFLFFFLLILTAVGATAQPLAVRLGYKATDKVLIVNCDDVGMCHSSNLAVIDGMERGLITSGTIMVPCPWFSEIAEYAAAHPEKDFGVHLTHTAEWKKYRWGPVSSDDLVKGLVDKSGYLWKSVEEVYASSSAEEGLKEARAQIKKAIDAGVPLTHIDSHMGTMQLDPNWLRAYGQLSLEFALPLRMAQQSTMEKFGFAGIRKEFADKGIVFTDYFVYEELDNYNDVKSFWTDIIKNLKPGVTELYIHASKESEELKAITGSWKERVEEARLFTVDAEFRKLIQDEGIILIGYRPLMELQRKRQVR